MVGPGAVGGLIAAGLRRAGLGVVLAGRAGPSLRAIRRAGLSVTGPDGRVRRVRGWLEVSPQPRPRAGCRAVFLCVKAPDIRAGVAAARRLAGREAPVVSLLNGLAHYVPVRRAFGPARSVFGVCYFAAMRLKAGAVRHTGGREVALAETPANADAVRAVRGLLADCGWNVRVTRRELDLLWTKLVYNAAVNPLGALALKPNGELAANPALRDLMGRALREGARIARRTGRRMPAGFERKVLAGCRAVPDQLNSMAQDILAGRRTEADSILKPLLAAARRAGAPAPVLGSLYRMVRRLEREAR